MNTKSSISYSGMRQAASEIQSYKKEMNNILNNTTNKMNTIEEVWKDVAEQETKSRFDSMSSKFQGFVDAVESYATFINNAVDDYEAADNKLKELAGQNLSN